jgi:hypothetical protein
MTSLNDIRKTLRPLGLGDQQLSAIVFAAKPLQPFERSAFLGRTGGVLPWAAVRRQWRTFPRAPQPTTRIPRPTKRQPAGRKRVQKP